MAAVERLIIRADGAARGNPGPAAAGAVLIDASRPDARSPGTAPLAVIARPLGIQTNNYAEYTAVLLALERAAELGAREVELVLDSKLVVEQLAGRWKVRNPALAGLHADIQRRLAGFRRWTARHEPRASNHAADALANLALDDPAAASAIEDRHSPSPPAAVPDQPGPRAARVEEPEVGRAAVGAACVIFDARDRVLLVRHAYGGLEWELPGGGSLPGESPDVAARRELEEETGLVAEAGDLTGHLAGVYYERHEERLGPVVHFVFRLPLPPGEPRAVPPEIEDVGFWPLARLPRPISDFTERRITDARRPAPTFGLVERRVRRS